MSSIKENLPEGMIEDEYYWSSNVLTLLQEMARMNTNAVLQVLADVEQVETEHRYPESGLLFANNHWRAFYHCHEATSMHPDEHGHFHLFTDLGDGDWAHVAGLSIDTNGQPLQWFMVNRWVTDGIWLPKDDFMKNLTILLPNNKSDGLVADWLASLLQLYRESLFELLEKRDEVITSHLKANSRLVVFENRNIYSLVTRPINLQATLEKNLLQNNIKATSHPVEYKNVG